MLYEVITLFLETPELLAIVPLDLRDFLRGGDQRIEIESAHRRGDDKGNGHQHPAVQAGEQFLIRITSYNVCYTKLLRCSSYKVKPDISHS